MFGQRGCGKSRPYLAPIPVAERGDLLHAYYAAIRQHAATAFSVWEGRTSSLLSRSDIVALSSGDEFALARSRIERHYFVNGAFFDHDGQLLITGMPSMVSAVAG